MPLAESTIPYFQRLEDGVYRAGQPSAEQLRLAQLDGLKTVVNLCPAGECGWDEKAAVDALGLTYISIPVASAADLTPATAQRLDEVIRTAEKPMMIHCGSSNRVGGLFALKALHVDGQAPEAALAYGKTAGLTGLEGPVRLMLGLPQFA